MKKKQKILIVIGIIVGILSVTRVSFALWSKTFFQTGDNTIASDCFQLVFLEGSGTGINLENSFPMFDADGKRLTPYTFSITNTCDSAVEYQLNLETTNQTTMKDSYIKVMLNEETPALLSSKTSTTPTITNGKSAYILESGTLSGNTKNEYTLRIWMDENVTQNDEGAMNSLFESKITITGSYVTSQQPLKEYGIKEFVIAKGTGLYEVSHENAEITSDLTEEQKANLKKTEYRYAGSNPNNYVEFNDELWRIIGLVNTPEGQRLKLTRSESIGDFSWDTSDSTVNSGWGVNEWSQADIMTVLNHGAYWNRTTGTCYSEQNNASKNCDFSSKGLTEKAKTMIDTITWNTGANGSNDYTSSATGLVEHFYNYERSNNTGKICNSGVYCNDTVERATLWQGKVGLIYPSDYGYATSGGSTTSRSVCFQKEISKWNDASISDCKNNDWLSAQWVLTPYTGSYYAHNIFVIYSAGVISATYPCHSYAVKPTIYLQQNIKIIDGEGTTSNPYKLGKKEIALPSLASEVIQNMDLVNTGSGLYAISHENAEITSNLTEEQKANLKKTEYRYGGSNPNNYVKFNDELWRIIGLVNTPEGQRLKLVRDESIGSYSWDTSDINVNGGKGVNEWSQADVMTLLNQGPYYQQSTGTCYNNENNATTSCDFTATGLTEKAKTMIDTITWNIGSDAEESYIGNNIHLMYNYERSNNIGKKCSAGLSCSDTVERTTLWSGKVGLIYPSDYGYATSGGQTITKETCQNIGFGTWLDSDKKDCSENDWLFSSKAVWTITPHVMNDTAYNGFNVNPIGSVSRNNVYNSYEILPSIYLKESIRIINGQGTESNPYILS